MLEITLPYLVQQTICYPSARIRFSGMNKPNFLGKSREEIGEILAGLGEKTFHRNQIFKWINRSGVRSFSGMTDLSKTLRTKLEKKYAVHRIPVAEIHRGRDKTARYVLALGEEGAAVETVYIPGERHDTLCLSTQVGCAFGCVFCLSGKSGFKRNLAPREIMGQFLAIRSEVPEGNAYNVVFMGMGEPLDNFDSVARTISLLTDPFGPALAMRRITLSTAGHIPGLKKLVRLPRFPKLAVSLNASDDAMRSRLMPINRKYPLKELMRACREIPLKRGERITFEYVLLAGYNDRDVNVSNLHSLLRGIPSKINLIPFNPTEGVEFKPPSDGVISDFADALTQRGFKVTVRRSRGADVGAACGQLVLRRLAGERSGQVRTLSGA
jgi:23S rRNA (adenine2503-C2)-methyltransferase